MKWWEKVLGLISLVLGGMLFQKYRTKMKSQTKTQETKHEREAAHTEVDNADIDGLIDGANDHFGKKL